MLIRPEEGLDRCFAAAPGPFVRIKIILTAKKYPPLDRFVPQKTENFQQQHSSSKLRFKAASSLVYTPRTWSPGNMLTSADEEVREPCGLPYQELADLSDENIMLHLAAGHGDAVAVLFDRYSRLVLNIAAKIVQDHTEAEDLTQEIFVELCRTAARFDPAKDE